MRDLASAPRLAPRAGHFFALTSLLAAALTTGVVACDSSPGGAGGTGGTGGTLAESPCDPLAPPPIEVGAVVGVGKDAPGTLYVYAANGIFVSSGDTLHRQHLTGAGIKGPTEHFFTFQAPSDDASAARNLLVETQGESATGMALGPADAKAFLDESPAGITMLALVGADAIAGMKVENTPNVIQYVGDVENGDVVMATLPMNPDATSTGGLALFYGPPSAVAQRKIVGFEQSVSGNGSVTFLVGGASFVLSFGWTTMNPGVDGGAFGEFELLGLDRGVGATLSVALRKPTPTTLPAGLSFTCY